MSIINSANKLILNKKPEFGMRQKHNPQISIFEFFGEHELGSRLKTISDFLDENPQIISLAEDDLIDSSATSTGRKGLAVESVVRAALVKQLMGLSYRDLSFLVIDSVSINSFTRITSLSISDSALQSVITRISAQTWEAMNRLLLTIASDQGIEKGRVVRIDSTVTETDIHPPSDSSLLWDCVRSMVSKFSQLSEHFAAGELEFVDHSKVAKQHAFQIGYRRGVQKDKLYRELIAYTINTKGYLIQALSTPPSNAGVIYPVLVEQAEALVRLVEQIIEQTQRRVINDEKVPASEKLFSIFETHTDIIVKGSRDVQYGHKLNFTTGRSGLVLDVVIEKGNPADSACFCPMLARQEDIYGRVPKQVAADGGYASNDNIDNAKEMGVTDVAFNKKRGIKVEKMAKSSWVYNKLKKFRAGIEGNISWLKRSFGLTRCLWKGLEKFKSYVWCSSLSYNLVVLARTILAAQSSPSPD